MMAGSRTSESSPYSKLSLYTRESSPVWPGEVSIPEDSLQGLSESYLESTRNHHPHQSLGETTYHKDSYKSYTKLPLYSYPSSIGSPDSPQEPPHMGNYRRQQGEELEGVDSGVFDTPGAVLRRPLLTRQDSGTSSGAYSVEDVVDTAQIRLRLEYRIMEEKLFLTVERARNLNSLPLHPVTYIFVRGTLLPSTADEKFYIKTRQFYFSDQPSLNEQFILAIERERLISKTLQLELIGVHPDTNLEDCLGQSQISLAEFECVGEIGFKWYNMLSAIRRPATLSRSNSTSSSVEALRQRLSSLERPKNPVNRSSSLNSVPSFRSCRGQGLASEAPMSNGAKAQSLSNLWSNSLYGSFREKKTSPLQVSASALQQLRCNKSADKNHVSRSVSDCSGYRRPSSHETFVRLGAGRRSMRVKGRLDELRAENGTLGNFQTLEEKNNENQLSSDEGLRSAITTSQLEMRLNAAYLKEQKLKEEIDSLNELKRRIPNEQQLNPPMWAQNCGGLQRAEARDASETYTLGKTYCEMNGTYVCPPVKQNLLTKLTSENQATRKKTCSNPPRTEVHWV